MWANSKALQHAGIDAHAPDPRAAGSTATSTANRPVSCSSGPSDPVNALIPADGPGRLREALLTAQQRLHSVGVTGWQDAGWAFLRSVSPTPLTPTWRPTPQAETHGAVCGAPWWSPEDGPDQIDSILERRATARGPRFHIDTAKVMQDGICENCTAAMLQPYRNAPTDADPRGMSFIDPEGSTVCGLLARHGFHIHARCRRSGRPGVSRRPDCCKRRAPGLPSPDRAPRHRRSADVPGSPSWALQPTSRRCGLGATSRSSSASSAPGAGRGDGISPSVPWPPPVRWRWALIGRSPTRIRCGRFTPRSTAPVRRPIRTPSALTHGPSLLANRLTLRQALDAYTSGAARVTHCAERARDHRDRQRRRSRRTRRQYFRRTRHRGDGGAVDHGRRHHGVRALRTSTGRRRGCPVRSL